MPRDRYWDNSGVIIYTVNTTRWHDSMLLTHVSSRPERDIFPSADMPLVLHVTGVSGIHKVPLPVQYTLETIHWRLLCKLCATTRAKGDKKRISEAPHRSIDPLLLRHSLSCVRSHGKADIVLSKTEAGVTEVQFWYSHGRQSHGFRADRDMFIVVPGP